MQMVEAVKIEYNTEQTRNTPQEQIFPVFGFTPDRATIFKYDKQCDEEADKIPEKNLLKKRKVTGKADHERHQCKGKGRNRHQDDRFSVLRNHREI